MFCLKTIKHIRLFAYKMNISHEYSKRAKSFGTAPLTMAHTVMCRTCSLNLSPENIRTGKFNVCLEYHIKNCAGPCIGLQSQEEYLKNIDEIKEILKGNTQEISRMLFQQMQGLAAEMKFEEAQKIP